MNIEIITPLLVEQVPRETYAPWLERGRDKFKLISSFLFEVDGILYMVPAGYIFDGSSIPRALWWIWPPTYYPAWRGSAFHDFCYSHLYKWVSKEWADQVFRAFMLHDGACPVIAGGFHTAVSHFGHGKYEAETV